MNRHIKGFTLIELMIVVSIISILAAVALPSYHDYVARSQLVEPITYSAPLRNKLTEYYNYRMRFPSNNQQAGLPKPEHLIGNAVTRVEIEKGAIHLYLGNKLPEPMHGKILTFRPAVVKGSPSSPISWLCGNAKPVQGMVAVGENKTTIPVEMMPLSCGPSS